MKIFVNGKETIVVDETTGEQVDISDDKITIDGKEYKLPNERVVQISILGDCKQVNGSNLVFRNCSFAEAKVNGYCTITGKTVGNVVVNGTLVDGRKEDVNDRSSM